MNPPASAFSVSPNGVLAYWAGAGRRPSSAGSIGKGSPWVVRRSAESSSISRSPLMRAAWPSIGSDTNPYSIWAVDVARGGATTQVTSDFFSASPVWSPDGTQIMYGGARDGPPNVWLTKLDRASPVERLTRSKIVEFPLDWTQDGKFAVYVRQDPKTGNDLWVLPMTGDRTPHPIANTSFSEIDARVSHDGRWMGYVSNESGRNEVYVTRFPTSGERWKVSTNGGERPTWRRDGRELFYREGSKLMAVSVSAGPNSWPGRRRRCSKGCGPMALSPTTWPWTAAFW